MTSPVAPAADPVASRSVLPGGVSAAARFNRAIGGPFVVTGARDGRVTGADGREYIDLNMGFGASMLGHSPAPITAALTEALSRGIRCGLEVPEQATVADRLCELVPSAEQVRFTLSGTETDWHAIRTARVATGRRKIVKFEGHFHGYSDHLGYSASPTLAEAGDPAHPALVPMSGGMPASMAEDIVLLPWNDAAAVERILAADPDIAAVIMEPVSLNGGGLEPAPGYLEAVRASTRRHGVVLIFDEILSGFRTGTACVQGREGVTPDLTTLGKILGGGLPQGALVGSREVMAHVAPAGRSVHSGAFQGYPLGIAAAGAVLDMLTVPGFYERLEARASWFTSELRAAFAAAGLPVHIARLGDRITLLFGLATAPVTYRDVAAADAELATRFYREAIARGVYFHSGTSHGISVAHTDEELTRALAVVREAAEVVAAGA